MSASRPPPIRDFASLKEAWGTEGKENSFDPRQTSPDNAPNPSGQPAAQESKPPLSDIPVPVTHTQDPQLEDQLRQARLSKVTSKRYANESFKICEMHCSHLLKSTLQFIRFK